MDSYFGQIGHSFYGGPNGQSFSIKETFPNKVALDADLNAGFASSIQVGEYVIISYGNPNADLVQYNANKAEDIENYQGQTFNATLWQKQYLNEGISYGEPITTFTTSVPNFIFSSQNIAPGAYGEFYAVKIGENSYSDVECTENASLVNQALEVENYDETNDSWQIKGVSPARYVKSTSVFATKIVEKVDSNEINRQYEIKVVDPWDFDIGEVTVSNPGGEAPGPDVDISNTNNIKYLNFTLPKPWNIDITKGTDLDANASPVLTSLSDTETTKQWKLQLPQPWGFDIGGVDVSDPGGEDPGPSVGIGNDSEDHPTTKLLNFTLPKPWNIAKGSDSGRVDPADPVSISIDQKLNPEENESATTKYIHIKIPDAWNIAKGNVERKSPDTDPDVDVNTTSATGDTSDTTKYLHFTLPVAQVFTTDAFTIATPPLGPEATAKAETSFDEENDTLHQYPKVELSLPRAAKTEYGSAMAMATQNVNIGQDITVYSSSSTDYLALSALEAGDFYINTTYAKIYKIKEKNINQSYIIATYYGSMQLAIPTIEKNVVNPYDASGNPVVPNVAPSPTVGPVSSWKINVDTVKAPRFDVVTNFIASTDSGSGGISSFSNSDPNSGISGYDTVVYSVYIPRGTRFTAYPNNKPTASGANPVKNGDLYLDQNGQITIYNANIPGWQNSISIKGNSFLIKNQDMTINVTDDDIRNISGSSIANRIGQYIENSSNPTISAYSSIKENEILNVNYSPRQDVWIAYWIFKAQNNWTGSQLTGEVSNAIVETSWQTEPLDNKAYSVTLINKLLGGATIAEENPNNTIYQLDRRIAALEAAFNLGWGTLPITG